MKNFKKLLALLLCLSLVIGCMLALASCGGNDDDDDGDEETGGLSDEAKAAAKYVNAFVNTATNLNTASITFSNETVMEESDPLLADGAPLYAEPAGYSYKNATGGSVLLKATETGFDAMVTVALTQSEKENGVWVEHYSEEQTYYLINNVSYTYYPEMDVWAAASEYAFEEVAAVIEQVKTFIETYKQTDVYEAAMNLAYELAGAGASVESGSLVIGGDDYKDDVTAIMNFLTGLEASDNAAAAINEFISIIFPDCEYTVDSLLEELSSYGSKTVKDLYDMIDGVLAGYGYTIQSIFDSIFEIEMIAETLPEEFAKLEGANLLELLKTELKIDPATTTVDDLLAMYVPSEGMTVSVGMVVETVKAQLKDMTVEDLFDNYLEDVLEIDFEDISMLESIAINAADFNVTVSLSGDKLSRVTVNENIDVNGTINYDYSFHSYDGEFDTERYNPEIDFDSLVWEDNPYYEGEQIAYIPVTETFAFAIRANATVEFGKAVNISLPANVSPVEKIWYTSYVLEGGYAEVGIYVDETYNEETEEYEFDGFRIWIEGYYDDYGNWVNGEDYYFNQFFPYGQGDVITFTAEDAYGYTVTVTINLEEYSISIN